MTVEQKLGSYIRSHGYTVSKLAENTGLNYQSISKSLNPHHSGRKLRANELLELCQEIGKPAEMFRGDPSSTKAS